MYIFIHDLLQETQKYKDNTEDRKMRFEALKKKDEGSSRLIAKQMKRLKKLQVSNGENLTVHLIISNTHVQIN